MSTPLGPTGPTISLDRPDWADGQECVTITTNDATVTLLPDRARQLAADLAEAADKAASYKRAFIGWRDHPVGWIEGYCRH